MHPPSPWRIAALTLALLTAACTPLAAATAPTAPTAPPPAAPVASPAALELSPDQVRYLAAVAAHQQAVAAFLNHVAAVRAAVPAEMVAVRWCEAGRYLGLPFGDTHYDELDHTGRRSTASGGYQYLDSTWRAMVAKYRPDLAGLWPRAGLAPSWVQDEIATATFHDPAEGIGHWNPSRSCWAPRS